MTKNIDFEDCIKSQQSKITAIKFNPHFTDSEKLKLIAECKNEINHILTVQTQIAMRELRKSKQVQTYKIHNYETL